ncbi:MULTISPECIES: hypothetical protein [unclassified Crossiella]|uniref:hypothetical protein n=1 Tax=unclassified Crossiella TaxID=2620835 RepID=UPI001FFE9EBA|nr:MULTISPECIES: hypothetical protein [unclassified Crossiella]MCK2245271.1 hypothetical protein [Crossiella sp. S99.2]MCK2258923.1 hypothetical protein [Crossiella sp. S99.1]
MTVAQKILAEEDPWYFSGWALALASIVVAVSLGTWAVWAAFRSARPRRILHISVDSAVPLVTTAPGLEGRQIQVILDGHTLTSPYVVTVDVISRSALDIAPAAFSEKPLELEFGVPLVALLDQQSEAGRPAVRAPQVVVQGSAPHLGPALITQRHALRYTVLCDGKPVFQPVAEMIDVAIREQPLRPPVNWTEILMNAIEMTSLALLGGRLAKVALRQSSTWPKQPQ